jgi:hypothetical protein
MPEPVASQCRSRDKQADASQNPNPATGHDCATIAASHFDRAIFQIEASGQHQRDRETKRD